MTHTSEPNGNVAGEVVTTSERVRATHAVGVLILVVVSLTAPVLVRVDDSVGDDQRQTKDVS